MALFEYFPNYIWNLSVAIAMESGGQIGEIVDMCQPIRDAAASGADAGTPAFMKAWATMGEKLIDSIPGCSRIPASIRCTSPGTTDSRTRTRPGRE